MKTFIFNHKFRNATLTISAKNFNEARTKLYVLLRNPESWVCDNEEGENEE